MKTIWKKSLSALLVVAMTFSLAACGGNAASSAPTDASTGTYKAGTYSAKVTGMHEMTVNVTVDAEKITDIKIDHTETEGIGVPVVETMPKQIIECQGLGLDAVSGATMTSKAIIDGVADCMKQAGADVEALKAIKPAAATKAEDQTIEVDVAVIGAGGAGMAAAVTANQAGSKVLVIEKQNKMGGNTILAGGALNAVDDGSETAKANEDSVEKHYTQTYEGGDKKGDPALVRTLVENAWDGVEWLKGLGMTFKEGTFTVTGGMWPRAHKPTEPVGTGFFTTYQAYIDSHENIDVLFNTKADELIVEDGKVTGVICTGETGNKVTVKAKNGVVLATGGFGANVEMRDSFNKQWPSLGESIKTTNNPGITGDGIKMAEAIGANLVQMENIQLLPLGDPQTGSLSGNIEFDVERRIFVNKEGNRFVNEGGRRDEMTLALFEQPEYLMYIVMDSDCYPTGDEKNNFNESVNDLIAQGRAFKGETLEELAKAIGVPAENLTATVKKFNENVASGAKDEFGRVLYSTPIDNGPFYAAPRVPTVHHTMGGVQINTDAQVLKADGSVINGLWAAGEVTGGIHGANRLGGNALTDTVVFGRIAGANAAAAK
ncbi:MAG: flavocytochrome c [Angelakisella sp.]